jgi:hypothetical protein
MTKPKASITMSFEDVARATAQDVAELVIAKQRDYGKGNVLKSVVRPELALAVRLTDKISRLVNLVESGAEPENESLIDTANDIIGYGIVLKMYLEGSFELPLTEK